MKKFLLMFLSLTLAVSLAACGAGKEQPNASQNGDKGNSAITESKTDNTEPTETGSTGKTEETTKMKMIVKIGGASFTATLEDNAAAHELAEMMKNSPVVIDMSDYSGFEKVGPLGKSLTAENRQTTTHAGDIVLYNGNQIVMFYGSNSWSYTRIGKIDDLTGWEEALGSGDITAEFSLAE